MVPAATTYAFARTVNLLPPRQATLTSRTAGSARTCVSSVTFEYSRTRTFGDRRRNLLEAAEHVSWPEVLDRGDHPTLVERQRSSISVSPNRGVILERPEPAHGVGSPIVRIEFRPLERPTTVREPIASLEVRSR